jgi:hypothetical protein
MIVIQLYSVFDRKAKVYNTPMFLVNDQVALRVFHSMVFDKDTMVSRYPEDYILYRVGEFNTLDGIVKGSCYPEEIAQGIQLKKEE